MIEARRAEQELTERVGRFGSHFSRVEPLRQVGKYVRGLMSDLPGKKCWTLAEYTRGPHPRPDAAAAGTCVVEHLRRDGHGAATS